MTIPSIFYYFIDLGHTIYFQNSLVLVIRINLSTRQEVPIIIVYKHNISKPCCLNMSLYQDQDI